MNWKRLFQGLGALWLIGCLGMGAAIIIANGESAAFFGLVAVGGFGLLAGLVVAAACPGTGWLTEKSSPNYAGGFILVLGGLIAFWFYHSQKLRTKVVFDDTRSSELIHTEKRTIKTANGTYSINMTVGEGCSSSQKNDLELSLCMPLLGLDTGPHDSCMRAVAKACQGSLN